MSDARSVEQIADKLAAADDFGRTRWHEDRCTYVQADATDPEWCDCMRGDLEWLIAQLAGGPAPQGLTA